MQECPECYSDNARVTPIMDAESCLRSHTQYICGTCGRCACVDIDKFGKRRAELPFKTLAIAAYYLRAAEVIHRSTCGIYEILDERKNAFFMIFPNKVEFQRYIASNPSWRARSPEPVRHSRAYRACGETQMRKLTPAEIARYIAEQKAQQEP